MSEGITIIRPMTKYTTNPCEYCKIPVDKDIWEEEMHMCIDCSHAYFDHDREYFLQFGVEVVW